MKLVPTYRLLLFVGVIVLPLTLLLAVFGLTAAYPLGVVLALGRQSRMPIVKAICVVYIELIRGVPLISSI